MKVFFTVALIVALINATSDLDCIKQQCPNEYKKCQNIFSSCFKAAMDCNNKCGSSNISCLNDCANASGNQDLKNCAKCGMEHCANSFSSLLNDDSCDRVQCLQDFTNECRNSEGVQDFLLCGVSFYKAHPECKCFLQY